MRAKGSSRARRYIALYFVLTALACVWRSLQHGWILGDEHPWVSRSVALIALALAFGVWRASEWARLAGGVLVGLSSARWFWSLGSMTLAVMHGELQTDTFGWILELVISSLQAAIAVYLLWPSTSESFAAVRARRSRSVVTA
jgi:hypothetical protein